MSTTLTLTANKSAAISRTSSNAATDFNNHTSATVDLSWNLSRVDKNYLLAGFPAVAASYDYKPILRAVVKAYLSCDSVYTTAATKKVWVEGVTSDWDEASVTSRKVAFAPGSGFVSVPGGAAGVYQFSALSEESARHVLLHGCAIHSYSALMWYLSVGTSRHSSPPQLLITFDDSNVHPKLTTPAPASGVRLNKASAITFSTRLVQSSAFTLKNLTAVSGTFEYRLKGASSTTTAAATISSTTISYTAPANTFAAGEYEYRFSVTDNLGQTASTGWSSFDTRDTVSTATADEPSGNLLDGDQPINFRWTHINESGSPPTGAELQKSSDGSAWTTFLKRTTSTIGYKCPAGSFTSGTWFWRVRTFNLDNVAGAWSDAASFVTVSAPSTPKVIVQASPRPLITWQTNEQSAYQIQLDTAVDTTDYGSGKSWRSPVYLDDGLHVARVRVQNSYGVWSEWGSATFTVSHTASGAVVLTVDADHRAELSWSYAGSWTEFVVYRDGVAIARTTDYSYTDDYSVGTVRYQVRACASDGTYNYSLSNEVTVSVMPETVMLSALGSGKWLFLRLSTAQHRTNTIKASRTFSLTHLSGRKFPEAELTEFCDRSISVSYATDDEAEKAALEALMGSSVCLKTPGGKMVIGILDTLSETESMFYSSYSFAVSQMHYPEEVDLDA
nr:MAG TPA: Oligo alginate lyase [Caudoviricetes sp.]